MKQNTHIVTPYLCLLPILLAHWKQITKLNTVATQRQTKRQKQNGVNIQAQRAEQTRDD